MQPGDLVLTLGAGNVYQAGDELSEFLRGSRSTKEQRSRVAVPENNPRPPLALEHLSVRR